jgi:hypothetical protein
MATKHTLIIVVFVALLSILLHHGRTRREPFDKFGGTELTDAVFGQEPIARETIFVSVASYRDPRCWDTIRDLYTKAKYPDRVFVGIVEQNNYEDTNASSQESCIKPSEVRVPQKQIRKLKMDYKEAAGPTKARQLASTLYKGETYYCQVDSHVRFVPDWDEVSIEEIKKCHNPGRSILTTYPLDETTYNETTKDVPVMCDAKFNAEGIPVPTAAMKPPSFLNGKPRQNAFIAAGFFFAPRQWVKDVPFDPGLDNLFQGEEMLLSARSYTNGYDIYTPSKNITLHEYIRKEKPKFWTDLGKSPEYTLKKKQSESRARRILQLESPVIEAGTDLYGLGTRRNIIDFWRHAGIDPLTKTATKNKFCS